MPPVGLGGSVSSHARLAGRGGEAGARTPLLPHLHHGLACEADALGEAPRASHSVAHKQHQALREGAVQ